MPAAFTHRRHAKQSHAARPKSWAGSPPTAQSSRQHSSVCFSIEGGPIRGCVNGLILRCGFRFRWGPDRRRWGPHQDDHFRRLISLLDQIWKGSNFGAGSQRTHPVNNRGLTCATPLALANNCTKESPQATGQRGACTPRCRPCRDCHSVVRLPPGMDSPLEGQDSNRRSLSRKRVGLFGGTGSAGIGSDLGGDREYDSLSLQRGVCLSEARRPEGPGSSQCRGRCTGPRAAPPPRR